MEKDHLVREENVEQLETLVREETEETEEFLVQWEMMAETG